MVPETRCDGLSLRVRDTVRMPIHGTVALGELVGPGTVRVGDFAVSGTNRFEIAEIQRFKEILAEAQASSVPTGFALGDVDPHDLSERTLSFLSRPGEMPELAPGGIPVPDQNVLVVYSEHRAAPLRHYGLLVLEGMTVRLLNKDGAALFSCRGPELEAGLAGSYQVKLRSPDGTIRYLVGPQPRWAKLRAVSKLRDAHRLTVGMDPRLTTDIRPPRLMTTARARIYHSKMWQPVLLEMLRTRGVTAQR